MQTSYIDLYLIHVPFGFHCDPETLTPKVNPDGNYALDMETDHIAIWRVSAISVFASIKLQSYLCYLYGKSHQSDIDQVIFIVENIVSEIGAVPKIRFHSQHWFI